MLLGQKKKKNREENNGREIDPEAEIKLSKFEKIEKVLKQFRKKRKKKKGNLVNLIVQSLDQGVVNAKSTAVKSTIFIFTAEFSQFLVCLNLEIIFFSLLNVHSEIYKRTFNTYAYICKMYAYRTDV